MSQEWWHSPTFLEGGGEAEAGEFQFLGQARLHSETLSQNKNK
jgi:hypothetical protein